MSIKIQLFLFLLIALVSCKETEKAEIKELTTVIHQLKTDKNNKFLSTLKPTEENLRLLFKDGESAEKVIAYSNMKWADVSKISANSMKPLTENADLKILSVSKAELQNGSTNGFPEEYLKLADHLQDGTKLYAMLYLNEDGTEQKMRSAFFNVSNTWMIVPLAYRAFE